MIWCSKIIIESGTIIRTDLLSFDKGYYDNIRIQMTIEICDDKGNKSTYTNTDIEVLDFANRKKIFGANGRKVRVIRGNLWRLLDYLDTFDNETESIDSLIFPDWGIGYSLMDYIYYAYKNPEVIENIIDTIEVDETKIVWSFGGDVYYRLKITDFEKFKLCITKLIMTETF